MKHEFGTIQFHLEHFDELLNGEQSWRLLYLPATVCPCRDRATGSPQPDCPRCRGYGFVWEPLEVREWEETFYRGSTTRPEVLPTTVRTEDVVRVVGEGDREYQVALEEDGRIRFVGDEPAHGEAYRVRYRAPLIVRGHGQNLAGRKDIGEYGEIDHRDMSLTLPKRVRVGSAWEENPAYYAGYPDRFVVLDARVKVHQVLYRGEEEALLYAYVYRVLSCVGMEKDYSTTAYTFGEDFVFEEGRVVWLPGRGPRAGRPYSITYLAAPEFYVFRELPQVRGQGGQELPRRLHLRLWELFPRPGAALGR
ncbi:hypothetical protein TthSNM66_18340 [Thermus thermophilus]|uniref:hypothetical protein n=1 Tax=Thermus thermophilus TaxID=274 RepID=UPI001FCB4A20|nr:hypothetical protein [Thermus thermophilus]BDG27198.1 hypothetical protein TthSNM66_18340 [Thermus thermophilus]